MFVTVTGNRDVLRPEHFEAMKDGAILANSGHFDIEIDVKWLESQAVAVNRKIRHQTDEYVLADGRRLVLLAEGRLVNLGAAEGHPAAVMDMSFADQALTAEWLVPNAAELEPGVYEVPTEIDKQVARAQARRDGRRHRHADPGAGRVPVQLGARFVTRIAVLGTGQVGRVLAGRLADVGHDVVLGSRTALRRHAHVRGRRRARRGGRQRHRRHRQPRRADHGRCGLTWPASRCWTCRTRWTTRSASRRTWRATQTESNAERIQAAFPAARVVKWLNTMNNSLMADPRQLPGPHTTFLAGDDAQAKAVARGLLRDMGWSERGDPRPR